MGLILLYVYKFKFNVDAMSKTNITHQGKDLPPRLPDDVGCAPRSPVSFCLAISPFYLHQLFLQFGPVDVISLELETGC